MTILPEMLWQQYGTVNEESQNGDNMVSFNHYAFGSVGEFYYRYILGIQPLEPGYSKIRLAPFEITIPSETEFVLPDGTVHILQPGSHRFHCSI